MHFCLCTPEKLKRWDFCSAKIAIKYAAIVFLTHNIICNRTEITWRRELNGFTQWSTDIEMEINNSKSVALLFVET